MILILFQPSSEGHDLIPQNVISCHPCSYFITSYGHYATNWKVAGSSPSEVDFFF
jgi:hypothetical protein